MSLYAVVLVGDSGVGKSHLMQRFVDDNEGQALREGKPTIGVEFGTQVRLAACTVQGCEAARSQWTTTSSSDPLPRDTVRSCPLLVGSGPDSHIFTH